MNPFISSLEETGNEWLIIFGFVTDSFHIDWRSFINNTLGVTSVKSVIFAHESYLLSQITVFLGFLEQYFQLVSKNLFEKYQKDKLHCLDIVFFGGNDYYAKLSWSTFSTRNFATVSNLEECRVALVG